MECSIIPSSAKSGLPLDGRHAFVTGSSRGIGASIAAELARLGAHLSLIGRDEAALTAQVEAITSASDVKVQSLILDVTDADQISSSVETAEAAEKAAAVSGNDSYTREATDRQVSVRGATGRFRSERAPASAGIA